MRVTCFTRPGLVGPVMLLALAALLGACGSAGPPAPATSSITSTGMPSPTGRCADDQENRYVAEIFDVAPVQTTTYAPSLQVDIYRPDQDPVSCRVGVVWVHGGGFTQASRDGTAEQAWGAALARRGYLLASIDYRLGTGAPFSLDQASTDPPDQAVVDDAVADARSALAWLVTNADDFGVDPDRLAVGGTSAGAMIALGAGLTAGTGTRPCAIVSIAGDLDPTWVGDRPPATLLIHGDTDQLVPYDNSVNARSALIEKGGTAELVTIAGAGHEITGPPIEELIAQTARWLCVHAATGCG